ncbi:MAG: translational GTPase TypA, partial [Bacilli bacterium]|nr:translational GTPase TypA [Bacilli bacterium]
VIDGKKCEPYEDLQIDLPEEYQGPVMEALGPRGAELLDMQTHENQVKLTYVIPSRGLLGFMTDFLTLTKGYGIINHTYREYRPTANAEVGRRGIGVMVATDNGQATHYAIQQLEPRGTLFIEPGAEVYQGMIVGENAYDMDLTCNVCRTKNLSNQRSVGKDPTVVLKRPRMRSLEVALDYINPDELVEVTPVCYRLRKKILDTVERKKYEAHHPLEGAK